MQCLVSRVTAATEKAEKLRVQGMYESAARIVAVDPGRNPIFTAVVHNPETMDTLQCHSPDNVCYKPLMVKLGIGLTQVVLRTTSSTSPSVISRLW